MEATRGDRRGHAGAGGDTRGPGVPSVRGDNVPSPSAPGDTGSAVSPPSPPGTERSPRDPAGDTDGDKVCAVCGDRASGFHFHVMSCEGCKGFFRRSIIKGVRFTCPLARRCPVTKAKRRQCQACRLQKCLDVGMRRDMIMSEEALRRRRELRGQRGQPGGHPGGQPGGRPGGQPGGQRGLTGQQQALVALLVAAHRRTFDSSFAQVTHCWPAVRLLVPSPPRSAAASGTPLSLPLSLSLSPRAEPEALSLLPQLAELSTFMIRQVINFAKEIPAFRALSLEAQIALLKAATLGICQIRINTVFNSRTKAWQCGQRCYTVRDGALAGFQQIYLEPLLRFHERLRRLRLHEAEYALLQAVLLFSPDQAGVEQREAIEEFQEEVALTLQSYIEHLHPPPEGRLLYPRLVLLLTELQTLKAENARQILHLQHLAAMTPLLCEIIS